MNLLPNDGDVGNDRHRIEELERKLKDIEEKALGLGLDEQISALLKITHRENPTYHLGVANFFREYSNAVLNVKQMGYYIGVQEMEKNGVDARMKSDISPVRKALETKLCTQEDCESDWYIYWLQKLKSGFIYHRKLWEFCYIAQQLYSFGMLAPGKSGLGFGCGEEPLPSLWASFGAASTATDLHPERSLESQQGWIDAGAHGTDREKLLHRNICPDEDKLALISHNYADMNDITEEFFGKYDFCWSSCAFEHLGSIEKGLQFIENSMKTLKSGGVSVHTTEFNLADGETIDNWSTVLFQRKHIEDLKARLEARGYIVEPLNFDAGGKVLDGLFDIPPWPWEVEKLNFKMLSAYAHLKKSIDGMPCTSIGLTVRKP